jgi:hypothetical protein
MTFDEVHRLMKDQNEFRLPPQEWNAVSSEPGFGPGNPFPSHTRWTSKNGDVIEVTYLSAKPYKVAEKHLFPADKNWLQRLISMVKKKVAS